MEGNVLGMETALNIARVIHYDMAMQRFGMAMVNKPFRRAILRMGLSLRIIEEGDRNDLSFKTLWTLGNFSRFIRPVQNVLI